MVVRYRRITPELPRVFKADNSSGPLSDESRQPRGQMRDQSAVGVYSLFDVGQVAAFDDAVEPLGATDQHTGTGAGQGVGRQ
jgi:hypothetical protein